MIIDGHLDLFSGIGGFSLALKRAGVEPEWIGFSDIDKYANELFGRRFKDAEELGNIANIQGRDLPKNITLLTGGFPCQPFSIAGSRLAFEDTRGTLFYEIVRILKFYIQEGRPIPYIVLENENKRERRWDKKKIRKKKRQCV
jgi:DNA (cytosine-5)-methyltransferase 1